MAARIIASHSYEMTHTAQWGLCLRVYNRTGRLVYAPTQWDWSEPPGCDEQQFLKDLKMADRFDSKGLTRGLRSRFVGSVLKKNEHARHVDELVLGYYVNHDERGGFAADVRDLAGQTVFEVRAGNELPDGESSLVEDGFMRHLRDHHGLQEYLRQMGVISPLEKLLAMREFEAHITRMRQDRTPATA